MPPGNELVPPGNELVPPGNELVPLTISAESLTAALEAVSSSGAQLVGATVQLQLHGQGFQAALAQLHINEEVVEQLRRGQNIQITISNKQLHQVHGSGGHLVTVTGSNLYVETWSTFYFARLLCRLHRHRIVYFTDTVIDTVMDTRQIVMYTIQIQLCTLDRYSYVH